MAFICKQILRLAAALHRQRGIALVTGDSPETTFKSSVNGEDTEIKSVLSLPPAPVVLNSRTSESPLLDVTLICGTSRIRANRLILSTYSPFFACAFTKGWKETTSSHIDLPDISPSSMTAILAYIYHHSLTEVIHDISDMIKLLRDSDFLQMDELVDRSFTAISEVHMNPSDFIDVIRCLEELSNRKCLAKIRTFLAANFNEITKSVDFLLLSASLLKDILQHPDIDKTCIDHVVISILRWIESDARRLTFLYDLLSVVHLWCPECLNNFVRKNRDLKWSYEISSRLSVCLKLLNNNKTQHERTIACFMENEMDKSHVLGIIDTETLNWKSKKTLYANYRATAVSYRHHLYFFGGNPSQPGSIRTSCSIVKYCPWTNSVLPANESLLIPVYRAGVGIFNDAIYIVNGLNNDAIIVKTVQCYNPRNTRCHLVASTNSGHLNPLVFSLNRALYIIGSITHDSNLIERYDCMCNQWSIITKIPTYCYQCSTTLHGMQLFVLNHVGEKQFHVYEFTSNVWSQVEFHGGPERVVGLLSIKPKNEPTILAVDVKGKLHKYDFQSSEWCASSESANSGGQLYVLQVHFLPI